jgi:hypothetical protein
MIVLGVLKTFGDVGNLMPTLEEHIKVAAGAQPGEPTKVQVLAGGRSMLLSGGINDGSASQLEKALEMAPTVTTVVFSSEGGWIREGTLLAEVIRRKGLNTYVEGLCASACTIAFLAGKERAGSPSAKLGFHASRAVGNVSGESYLEESEQLRSIYRSAGLPESFIGRVIDTPSESMWFPSYDELLQAGVLTRRSFGGEVPSLATEVRSKEALISLLMQHETFSRLSERSRLDFDRVMEAAWERMEAGLTDAEVLSAARAELASVFARWLPLAGDETLSLYVAFMRDQSRALRMLDPRACAERNFPSGGTLPSADMLSPELRVREQELIRRVIEEANPARAMKPSQALVNRLGQQLAARMSQEQLSLIAHEGLRHEATPEKVCDAAIAFYSVFTELPVLERGRAVRIAITAG